HPDSLEATVEFSVRGIHAHRAAVYLEAMGLRADHQSADVSGKATLRLQAVPGQPGVASGTATLSDLSLALSSETVSTLSSSMIDIAALSPSSTHARSVQVADGHLRAVRSEDGTLTFASVSRAIPTAPTPPATNPAHPAAAFAWQIDQFTAS